MIVDQDMCGVWEGSREVRMDVVGTKQGSKDLNVFGWALTGWNVNTINE
jgi:hypothetical protein